MKKIVSLLTSVLLIGSMAIPAVSAASTPAKPDDTTSRTISLTKEDPNDSQTKVQGAGFSAWRVLAYNGTDYQVDPDFATSGVTVDAIVTEDGAGHYTSFGTTSKLEKQIQSLQDFATSNPVTADATGTTAADGTLTLDVTKKQAADNSKVDAAATDGVYLVVETSPAAGYTVSTQSFLVAVPENNGGTWNYAITAKPKNTLVKVEKTADGEHTDAYEIGSVIPFTVTAKVPDYGMSADYPDVKMAQNFAAREENGISKFNNGLTLVFEDTMSTGLTLDLSSVVVKIKGAGDQGADVTLRGTNDGEAVLKQIVSAPFDTNTEVFGAMTFNTSTTDYSAVQDGQKLTISIPFASVFNNTVDYEGKEIEITYNATLNQNAAVGAADGEHNDVKYTYSNDPSHADPSMSDPPRVTTTDENKIYTYQMNLDKLFNGKNVTDAKAADSALTNDEITKVTFQVYDGSTALQFIKTADGRYTVWSKDDTAAAPQGTTPVEDVTVAADGTLELKGLSDKTYTLKESQTAAGYSPIGGEIQIQVQEVVVDGAVTKAVSASVVGGSALGGANADGVFNIEVNNTKSQFKLPQTGGLGLWIFTIGGGVLMAGAIIFISVLRKKKNG